ncbi:FkbM family methyltransferase [Phragmitibacter flavus]|uniref:FkbM family methyltransferase n=1 Tax=Phragmitibacter flavus TaxID=2576071 RepID=A0A5R8K7W2_9BACT|nr:FkbM family methyltransferase [Phragmitibacter flavus]TLD68426.1 FkbM family methyltransferase [Phragmitibacter flavus]
MSNILYFLYRAKKRLLPTLKMRHYSFVENMRGRLVQSLRKEPVEILGQRMLLDTNDALNLALNRIYEPAETELLQKLIKPGDTIVDVGANIGYYSLIFAKAVGPTGTVFGFEPDPGNFSLLTQNLKLNGHENVTMVNKAVTDKSGEIELFVSPGCPADHRIYDSGDGRQKLTIPAVALDDYFSEIKAQIDLIKMDIQGAEFFAVKGMKKVLATNPKVKLLTEFWPFGLKRAGVDPMDYLKLLREIGLKVLYFDESNKTLRTAEMQELIDLTPVAEPIYCNLLCEPER